MFFAPHPLAGIHGLGPNVYDIGSKQIAGLYAWYDHKVIEYKGVYWDPCYNKKYQFLQDMALALIIGINEDKSPTKSIQEAMARISEYKVMIKNWFQVAYFRSVPLGEGRGGSGEIKVEGPYAESICGDENTYGDLNPIIKWKGVE